MLDSNVVLEYGPVVEIKINRKGPATNLPVRCDLLLPVLIG